MNATKEKKRDLVFYRDNSVTGKSNQTKELFRIVKDLSRLKSEGKITEDQLIASLRYVFSYYAENKILEKIDFAFDKTALRHSLS